MSSVGQTIPPALPNPSTKRNVVWRMGMRYIVNNYMNGFIFSRWKWKLNNRITISTVQQKMLIWSDMEKIWQGRKGRMDMNHNCFTISANLLSNPYSYIIARHDDICWDLFRSSYSAVKITPLSHSHTILRHSPLIFRSRLAILHRTITIIWQESGDKSITKNSA